MRWKKKKNAEQSLVWFIHQIWTWAGKKKTYTVELLKCHRNRQPWLVCYDVAESKKTFYQHFCPLTVCALVRGRQAIHHPANILCVTEKKCSCSRVSAPHVHIFNVCMWSLVSSGLKFITSGSPPEDNISFLVVAFYIAFAVTAGNKKKNKRSYYDARGP